MQLSVCTRVWKGKYGDISRTVQTGTTGPFSGHFLNMLEVWKKPIVVSVHIDIPQSSKDKLAIQITELLWVLNCPALAGLGSY